MAKETEYRCSICGNEFVSRQSLGSHSAAHTRRQQKLDWIHSTLHHLRNRPTLHHHINNIHNRNIIQSTTPTTTIMSHPQGLLSLGSNFQLQEPPKDESLNVEIVPRTNTTLETDTTSTSGSGRGGNGVGGLWAYACDACGLMFMAEKTLLRESSTRIHYCHTLCTNTKPATCFQY